MICQTPVHQVCNYGADAQYSQPPSTEQILNGVIPLDSLPADWWNFLWNDTNRAVNEARTGFTQVLCELNTVLSCASITANQCCYNQLYQSIDKIRQTIGTSTVAGAVKSSDTNGQVSIADTGIMTANGLGNVSDICYGNYNNMVTAVNCFRNWSETCFGNVSTCLSALGNSKAPTNHASTDGTYGIGTSTQYGHVMVSDNVTEKLKGAGIAASQNAVAELALNTTTLGNTTPSPIGAASAGVSTCAARADHTHALCFGQPSGKVIWTRQQGCCITYCGFCNLTCCWIIAGGSITQCTGQCYGCCFYSSFCCTVLVPPRSFVPILVPYGSFSAPAGGGTYIAACLT